MFTLWWDLNSIHSKILVVPDLLNNWCWGKLLLHFPAANSCAWGQAPKLSLFSVFDSPPLPEALLLRDWMLLSDYLSCSFLLPVSSDPHFSEHLNFLNLIPLGPNLQETTKQNAERVLIKSVETPKLPEMHMEIPCNTQEMSWLKIKRSQGIKSDLIKTRENNYM